MNALRVLVPVGGRDRSGVLIAVLVMALAALAFLSLTVGSVALPFGDILASLGGGDRQMAVDLIVWEIRLPRIVLGIIVGASLGLSGAALQGLLRNPLADPGVIGVTASAGLGAVIAIYFGFTATIALALPGFAMAAALLSTLVLYVLAHRDSSVLTLILVGIGINSLAVALTALAMNMSPNPFFLSDIVLWLLGSLSNRSFTDIALAAPFAVIGGALILTARRSLRALTLGEEAAATMGADLRFARGAVIVGSSLAVGASVAVTGSIGFIGLVVPHMVRPFTAHDPARILLPSALGGAILLTLADLLTRVLPTPEELKLGVVTALVGAPFFIVLILKTRRSMR